MGILAGLVTLLVVGLVLSPDGDNADDTVQIDPASASPLDFRPGTCFNFGLSGGVDDIAAIDCATPHQAEMAGQVSYPDANGPYPGADTLNSWAVEACDSVYRSFLGDDVLTTSLDGEAIYPDEINWVGSSRSANCYLTTLDGSLVTGTLADGAANYPRGERVIVSRLTPGDCFRAESGTDPFKLDSRSVVSLAACNEPHHGVFFGRDRLDFPAAAQFPEESLLTSATTAACARLFQSHFGVSVDGFNFRYWRPSLSSWSNSDRTVLCTILDNTLIEETFAPTNYRSLFDIEPGSCFQLGPEEKPSTLGIDDKVLPTLCDEEHVGQMIKGGHLGDDENEEFPGEADVKELAQSICFDALGDFLGAKPSSEQIEDFKFWRPNEYDWQTGDRRYACSYALDQPISDSLEADEA